MNAIHSNNPFPAPFKMRPAEEFPFENDSDAGSDDSWIQDARLALELQGLEGQELDPELERFVYQVQNQFNVEDQLSRPPTPLSPQLKNEFDEDEWQPRQLQDEFDAEDQQLRQEEEELVIYVRGTFQCNICMDELPEDDVAEIDGCMHTMCRTCLREFVCSKIQEHRYPIFCPMCTAKTDEKAEPSAISRALIEQLGIDEDQSQILTEMELAEFTIQIHCRRCQRPAFVDREDHAETLTIICPQIDCHHIWCKKCDQTIVADGPDHSCDGSSELEKLMEEMGWKHCPNCTTPILKETGCHHMTCISPGCNTHFCYVCGEMIVRSALKHEISNGVSEHYQTCRMFDEVDDED